MPHVQRPLILSAGLDPSTFAWLDGLRQRHFPPGRNLLPAHLTLFHALPGEQLERVRDDLARTVAQHTAAIEGLAQAWVPLGAGVAMRVASPALDALRAQLAGAWRDLLTRQDAQGFRAHVTVQNKAATEQARALHAQLAATHEPRPLRIEALLLWHYDGGPWEPAGRFGLGAP